MIFIVVRLFYREIKSNFHLADVCCLFNTSKWNFTVWPNERYLKPTSLASLFSSFLKLKTSNFLSFVVLDFIVFPGWFISISIEIHSGRKYISFLISFREKEEKAQNKNDFSFLKKNMVPVLIECLESETKPNEISLQRDSWFAFCIEITKYPAWHAVLL